MTRRMARRLGLSLSVPIALLAAVPAIAAPPGPGPGPGAPARSAAPPAAANPGQPSRSEATASTPAPQVSQDAAARTRMHECGHQWSSLKKAGNTGTLTWKEFSATCLAYNK